MTQHIPPTPHRRVAKWLGPFRYLTLRQIGWIHFKVALLVWSIMIFFFTPTAVEVTLKQPILGIWSLMTAVGCLISIAGIVLGSHPIQTKSHTIGPSLELAGWCFVFIGPAVYTSTQFYLLIVNPEHVPDIIYMRGALSVFAYAMCAALITRGVILTRIWRRQLKMIRTGRY